MEIEINRAIAERARAGEVLTDAELSELETVDLLSLGMLADEVRRLRVGTSVTYARVLEPDALQDLARLVGLAHDGVEVRFSLPETSADATIARVVELRAAIGPGARLTGFSLSHIQGPGWESGGSLRRLRAAGLDAVAWASLDVVTPAALDAVAEADLQLGALTVERMPTDRIGTVMSARRLLAGRPWIRSFAPLSREQSVSAPTTGYHDVKMVALARLGLPAVRVIQVDWRQYGPKLAQVALTFGANHLDRVSPVDDPALGARRASVEEVRRNIAAAGFTPAEQGAPA